jgi:hypothetical protein
MASWLRIGAIAVAASAALWAGGWFVVATTIDGRVRAWAAAQAAQGARVAFAALEVGGFPTRFRLRADGWEFATAGADGWSLRGARLEATLVPWDRGTIVLHLPGAHRIERRRAGDGTGLGIEAQRPDGVLRLDARGGIRALELDLGKVALTLPPSPSLAADQRGVTVARLQVAIRPSDPPHPQTREFLALALRAEDVVLPRGLTRPMDATIRLADAGIALRGETGTGGGTAERILAWRDSGGVVELTRLELDWAPLRLTGDGTAALDARNRPQAALTLRVAGLPDLIDALARARQIGLAQAAAFKALAAGMARTDPATGRREVALPVTAQDGRLAVAGIALMPLAPIPLPPR